MVEVWQELQALMEKHESLERDSKTRESELSSALESAKSAKSEAQAHKALFGDKRVGHPDAMPLRQRPLIDKWTFSTNGVAIQGRCGIPCVGFGPGAESQAHAPNEITWKRDLVTCAAVYAAVPGLYGQIV